MYPATGDGNHTSSAGRTSSVVPNSSASHPLGIGSGSTPSSRRLAAMAGEAATTRSASSAWRRMARSRWLADDDMAVPPTNASDT